MENSSRPTVDPILDPSFGATTTTQPRRRFELRRSRTDRMLGGVCGGLAEALGADPALVRLGLVALTVLGAGSGGLLYIAAWILVPEADA
ncbi:PspC domain-containing protein [Pseudonocardia lacus]|uniref:PspC domain-containing protein n=1 Tax=Pseudonocardia lacus TaxID=2835865 RepID=UPI001BDBE1B0|nr:PspC domain-containing protein [Pseudonocardia lacus]